MSSDVADLIAMVEDLRVLDAILGETGCPEQSEDLQLIRNKLDKFNAVAWDAVDEDADLLNEINKAEVFVNKLNKLNISLEANAEEIFDNFVCEESLVLSAQNAFIRRLLGTSATSRVAAIDAGASTLTFGVDFCGLFVNFRVLQGGDIQAFAISDSREEPLVSATGGVFQLRLTPDLRLSVVADGQVVEDERRADLLWLLEAENPKLKVVAGEEFTLCLID